VIFHTLATKTPPSQSAAADSLAELVSAAPSEQLLPRLPRLCRALEKHLAKTSTCVQMCLLRVLASLSQASAIRPQCLNEWAASFIAFMIESLRAHVSDWTLCSAIS
jgi:hypothetical protein